MGNETEQQELDVTVSSEQSLNGDVVNFTGQVVHTISTEAAEALKGLKAQPIETATLVSTVTPALPTWTDAGAVTSYITSIVAAVFAIVTAATGKGEPAVVQAILPAVGMLVAGVAQVVNVVTHRNVQKAAIVASIKK